MKKVTKERPKYSIFQNIVYMLKAAWDIRKSVIWLVIISSLVTVANSTTELFVVPQILSKLETQEGIGSLLATIALFTGMLILWGGLMAYIRGNTMFGRVEVQIGIMRHCVKKIAETSYPNLLDSEIDTKINQAGAAFVGEGSSTRTIWETLGGLLTNIIGFIIYLSLLSNLNIYVIILIAITAVVEYFLHDYLNEWHFRHRNDGATPMRHMNYSCRVSQDTQFAKDIRLFGMEQWISNIYKRSLKTYEAFLMRGQFVYLLGNIIDVLLMVLRNGIAYFILINMVLNGSITVSAFLLYFSAITGFTSWVSGILQSFSTLKRESININIMREFLDIPEPFVFDEGEHIPDFDNSNVTIELRNVSFRYPESTKDILSNINLTVNPGERLAIVGLNGAGKTTLVYILCGLLDPTEGMVLLNGKDIRKYNRKEYYSLFSAVFQNFEIFPSTIADNVSQEPECDVAKATQSLKMAGLLDKVNELSDGIFHHVGNELYDDGINFSGGELQRLMLARALYKDGLVLLLDEPTAALDAIAEQNMYETYNEMTNGKSSIYISHRLASTRFCDRIIMLQDGHIIETGTHNELLDLNGAYAELFNIQSKYYKGEVEN